MEGAAMASLLETHLGPWTAADLDAFPEKFRVEIIDGTLLVHSNPFRADVWTEADLDLLPESTRFEIIDGILFVNAAPNPRHQSAADNLLILLRRQLAPGLRAIREIAVTLPAPPVSTAIPDLVVLDAARMRPDDNAQDPEIVRVVVEVASPSTEATDRTLKAEKYAEAGIPAYWRVELDPITVICSALVDSDYLELGTWREGETVEVDQPFRCRFDPAELRP